MDDEIRSLLATTDGYPALLSAEHLPGREDPPPQIGASTRHLSDSLVQRAIELSAEEDTSEDAPARRVLVIADDPVWQRLVQRMLPTDFELLQADTAADALDTAGTAELEFALLTWRATRFSGPETLAELKIRYPDLKVIVIADANDDIYGRVAEALGADVFLMRPLSSLQLLAAVDDLLGLESDLAGAARGR